MRPLDIKASKFDRFVADGGLQSNLVPDAHLANLVPDAHLAALALEHGLVLCSTDADFARFPGLRWRNPLRDDSDR